MQKQVRIESGILEGYFGYDPRITVFKGVPYAAPPVGELRWRSPQPMPHWEGVRPALKYGAIAMQWTPGADPNDFWSRELHPSGPEYDMSEDCLYLNIFTPAKNADDKLPVLFYIHGGGYQGGYPYEVEFDWEHVARRGIVVVAVTYRLGVFGFLAHPELSAQSPDLPKGNYGIEDQLCALSWTRRNIAAFGGDPDRITIAGQSAGAGSVQCLLTAPAARGMIAGAIIQSAVSADFADMGPSFLRAGSLSRAEDAGAAFFDKAGISSLAEARALPAKELFRRSAEAHTFFAPVVDNVLLFRDAFDAYMHDEHHRVPVLTGYNRGEVRAFMRGDLLPHTKQQFEEFAARYGDRADEFRALCRVETDEDAKALFASDAFTGMVAGAYLFGTLQARESRTAYLYEFDPDIPDDKSENVGSFHGAELWFAYDSLARSWRPFRGHHYDLAHKVASYWANFVKTGDPNGKDNFGDELPEWRPFTEDDPFMLSIRNEIGRRETEPDEVMKFRINYTLDTKKTV